jgi:hypothetical protein
VTQGSDSIGIVGYSGRRFTNLSSKTRSNSGVRN